MVGNINDVERLLISTFSGVVFNDEFHKYYVDSDEYTSVTKFIKRWVDDVDFKAISENIDRKLGLPYGTTNRMWKLKGAEASVKGKRAHYFGEVYLFYRNVKPTTGYEIAIKRYIDNLPPNLVPLFAEFVVYDRSYKIAGTIDVLLYDIWKNKLYIADYKTNEVLDKNYKEKKLKPPFDDIIDSPMGKYILQLNMYKHILEKNTGIPVSGMEIVHIYDDGRYNQITVPDYTDRIEKAIKDAII